MPDVRQNDVPYDYNNELADTGIQNVPTVSPLMLKVQTQDSIEQPVENGSLLDKAMAVTNQTVEANNPWMASNKFNTPINTKLKETERYQDKTLGFNPLNINQEYQYGEQQSFVTQWKNNLLKAGANAAGFFVDTIAAIPEVVNAAANGDMSKLFNNDINNGVATWMDDLENKLPNYESFTERDHPLAAYLYPRYWGNSWGGLVKNVAGVVGAIGASVLQDAAIASVTEGVGELPLVAAQLTQAFGKLSKVIGGGEKSIQGLNDALNAGKNIERSVNSLSGIKSATNATRYGLELVTSSMANGAFQAQQTYKTTEDALKQRFFEENGYEASGEDLAKIQQYATSAGNTDLLAVVATSTMTHAVILPSLLKPMAAARKYFSGELSGASKIALKEGSNDVFESSVNQSKGIKGLLRKTISPLGKGVLAAADLDAQMIIQRSAEDFYKRKFDDHNISTTDNLLKSLSDSSKEFLFSKEGTASTITGLLTGVALHGIGAFMNARRGINTNETTQNQTILNLLNSHSLTGIFEGKYDETLNGIDIQQRMNDAVKNNNVFEFNNLKFQQLFDFVHSGVKSNRFDLRLDQLESLKDLNDGDFRKMFGMEPTTESRETASQYIDNVINKANEIKKNVVKVDTLFDNPHNLKTAPVDYLSFEDYKKQLALNLSEMGDNRRRISGLATQIGEIAPTIDVNKIVNLTSREGVDQTIKDFKARLAEIATDKKLAEGVDQKYVTQLKAEEKFLNDKVEAFSGNLETFNPDVYMKHVEETMNYYSNTNRLEGTNSISPIDVLGVYNQAADIYKLGVNAGEALDNYRALVTKKGFGEYMRRVNAKRDEAADKARFDNNGDWVSPTKSNTHLITEDPTDTKEVPAPGVESIDANGNPITTVDQFIDSERVKELEQAKNNATTPAEAVEKQAEVNQKYDEIKKSKAKKDKLVADAKRAGVELSVPDIENLSDEDLMSTLEKPSPTKTSVPTTKKLATTIKSIYRGINPFTFLNKVFSTNRADGIQEQANLRDIMFSLSPSQINEKAGIRISESTKGKTTNEYSKIGDTELYRRGYGTDVELTVDGKVVGRLQPSDSLFYKDGDTYKPITELPKSQYVKTTGNTEASYEDFMSDVTKYDSIYKAILNTGKSELTAVDINPLFDLVPNYGGRQNVNAEKAATKVADIKHNREGDVFLSVPMVYNTELKAFERTTAPTVLNGKDLSTEQKKELTDFLVKNGEKIRNINSRYIYLKRLPNGKLSNISIIAARAARAGEDTLNGVFKVVKDFTTNNRPSRDIDVRRTNANLKDAVYIADSNNPKGSKTNMFLSGDKDGNAYFNIVNPDKEYSKRIKFTENDLKDVNNFDSLVNTINNRINELEGVDKGLSRLNLKLNREDFKRGILEDESVPTEQLAQNLTLATTPEVFENFSLNIVPKGEEVIRGTKTSTESPVERSEPVRGPKGTENTKVSIPLVITKDIRQQLYDYGYKKADVDRMTPQEANDLLKPVETDESAAFDTTKLPFIEETPAEVAVKKVRIKKVPNERIKNYESPSDIQGYSSDTIMHFNQGTDKNRVTLIVDPEVKSDYSAKLAKAKKITEGSGSIKHVLKDIAKSFQDINGNDKIIDLRGIDLDKPVGEILDTISGKKVKTTPEQDIAATIKNDPNVSDIVKNMADADPKVLVDEIYQQAIGETADGAKVVPDRASAEKTFGKEAVEKAIALKEAETQKLSGERRTPAEDKISIYAYHGDIVAKGITNEEKTTFSYGKDKPTIYIATDPDIKSVYSAEKAEYKEKNGDLKGFDDYLGKAAAQANNGKTSVILDLRGLNKEGIIAETNKLKSENQAKADEAARIAQQKALESDFPQNPQEDWQKPALDVNDYGQRRIIQKAALDGDYVKAVDNGEISYQQAINILKSADIAPTKNLLTRKPKEGEIQKLAVPNPELVVPKSENVSVTKPETEAVSQKAIEAPANQSVEEVQQDQPTTSPFIQVDPNLAYKEGDSVSWNGEQLKIEGVETMKSGRSYYILEGDKIIPAEEVEAKQVAEREATMVVKPTADEVITQRMEYAAKTSELTPNEAAEKAIYDYVGLQGVLGRLMEKYGIPYKIVGEEGNWKGRFNKGVVEINIHNYTNDTPFHEYYHPFIEILKVDNNKLYTNIAKEFSENEAGKAEIERVQKSYPELSAQEQFDEALVSFMGKAATQHFEVIKDAEGKTIEVAKKESSLNNFAAKLYNKFKAWFQGLWKNNNSTNVGSIPDNASLQDVIDISSLHDVKINLGSTAKITEVMSKYQKVEGADFDPFMHNFEKKLKVLEDTANRRTPSDILVSEVKALKAILRNEDMVISTNSYIKQGADALDFANREFTRITRRIAAGNLTQDDVKSLNADLGVIKNLTAFYDDVGNLFNRVADGLDDEEYRSISEIIGKNNAIKTGKLNRVSRNLVSEWLYPYVEDLRAKTPEHLLSYLPTKEEFNKQIGQATEDSNNLFYLLGSVGSSKDPISAVTSNVLRTIVDKTILHDVKLSQEVLHEYSDFLAQKGLKNDKKSTEQYYKDNYLHKVSVQEKIGNDKDGKPEYGYVDRWALHTKYDTAKFEADKVNFIEKLGNPPEDPIALEERTNKLFEWNKQNTQIENDEVVPSNKYKNAEFEKLYNKDKFFTKLHDTYKNANESLGEQSLKHGIVPQVSNGKSAFSDLTWAKGFKGLGKALSDKFRAEPSDYQHVETEDGGVNYAKDLVNLDGSTYKSISTAYTRMLEENDLNLTLPETINKYTSSSNMYKAFKEVEPNILTLKSVLEGNTKLGIESRKIAQVSNDSKPIFDRIFGGKASKDKLTNRVNKQLLEHVNDVVYGDRRMEEHLKIFGFDLSLNKVGDSLGFLTALNNMAGNLNAGIVNVTIGNLQSLGEAVGGRYTTPKDWVKAQADYTSHLPDFFKDATSIKKSLLSQLAIIYDAIQGEYRDNYGKKVVGNIAQKYATGDSLFILSHAGEHQIQISGMLALMNGQKVPMKDGTFKTLRDIWSLDEKGYAKLDPNAIWSEKDNLAFMSRLHSINKVLNGNYSDFDRTVIQRRWYGKLTLLYRKYLYNAFRARYGGEQYNYELQDVTSGYYRKFFNKLTNDIKTYKFEAVKRLYTKEGWNPEEKYAFNKTLYEASVMAGSTILALAIARAEDGSKKKDNWGWNELYLQLLKVNNDMSQYTVLGIPDMVKIIQNPTAVLNTLVNYEKFFGQLFTDPTQEYKRKTGAYEAGESVLKARFFKALPIMRQAINFMSPEEQKQYYLLNGLAPK